MKAATALASKLDPLHLLQHPFYQAWSQGTLAHTTLQIYAQAYYQHVAAFPRYISQIHTLCPDLAARQVLVANLVDEEQGEDNHIELWIRFAEGLGVTRKAIQHSPALPAAQELVAGYFALVKTDYPTGLGALYAYERQTPAIAAAKIEGLEHYALTDERTLQFFVVHQQVDIAHTEQVASLIEQLTPAAYAKAAQGAQTGAALLWSFLDGMMQYHVRYSN